MDKRDNRRHPKKKFRRDKAKDEDKDSVAGHSGDRDCKKIVTEEFKFPPRKDVTEASEEDTDYDEDSIQPESVIELVSKMTVQQLQKARKAYRDARTRDFPRIDPMNEVNVISAAFLILENTFDDIKEATTDDWIKVLNGYNYIFANKTISSLAVPDAFKDQLKFIYDVTTLSSSNQWELFLNSVTRNRPEDEDKVCNSISKICRYRKEFYRDNFDRMLIFKKISDVWKNNRISRIDCSIKLTSDGDTFKYSTHESLESDMFVLLIGLVTNKAIINDLDENMDQYIDIFMMLMTKYDVKEDDNVQRVGEINSLNPDVVTLCRIAAVFPLLTCRLYYERYGEVIANVPEFTEQSHALFSPVFPSVVRKGYRNKNGLLINIHPQLILIAILIDNVFCKEDSVTPLEQIWTHYQAAYHAELLNDSRRIEVCDKYKITVNGKFVPSLLNLRAYCEKKIGELRPSEKIVNFLQELRELC